MEFKKCKKIQGLKIFSLSSFLVLLLIISWLPKSSSGFELKNKSSSKNEDSVSLAMPSGWDDSILEKINKGEDVRRTIAVLEFEGYEKIPQELILSLSGMHITEKGVYIDVEERKSLALSDMLITFLVNTGKFNVVERTRLEKVLGELALQQSDLFKNVTELGKLLGADAVVFGTITGVTSNEIEKISYKILEVKVQVDVRAVDVTTGKIITSKQAIGVVQKKNIYTSDGTLVSGTTDVNSQLTEAFREATKQVSDEIASHFLLLGYVVMVSGDKIITDVGAERGVKDGDVFIVFRQGKEIMHPATGKRIGWDKEVLAAIRINSFEQSLSTGEIIRKKDEFISIKPGDMVIAK